MATIEKRGPFSQVTIENGLHQAAALAAMTLLVTAHRAVMNTGFTLRRRGISTDTKISLMIGALAGIWTLLVTISGLYLGERPCRHGLGVCAARLSYAPWMLLLLFFFWLIAFVDQKRYLQLKEMVRTGATAKKTQPLISFYRETTKPGATITTTGISNAVDVEQSAVPKKGHWRLRFHLPMLRPGSIWKMKCSQGPYNWAGSINPWWRRILYALITVTVTVVSIGALSQKLYTVGLLNIVGVVLFVVGAAGSNKYDRAPHLYTADSLRVMLATRHCEGTSYILPARDRGMDAVWGPKIFAENKALDQAVERAEMSVLENGGIWSERVQMHTVLAAFNAITDLNHDDIVYLSRWLYEPDSVPHMRAMACQRIPEYNLMAPNLIAALWHAEYLVFMRQASLPEDLKKAVAKLRTPRGTGLDLDRNTQQIGAKRGIAGYQEVVRYIYFLLDQPVDEGALWPKSKPPRTSCILEPCPDAIEEYFGQLWDHCFAKHESSFAAMWALLSYREADIGNDTENGWHGFPLRAWDREGDMNTWHMIWRQAWYSAIISQLTSMSPIILSAFVAGILQ